jgi:hypothetical protein
MHKFWHGAKDGVPLIKQMPTDLVGISLKSLRDPRRGLEEDNRCVRVRLKRSNDSVEDLLYRFAPDSKAPNGGRIQTLRANGVLGASG